VYGYGSGFIFKSKETPSTSRLTAIPIAPETRMPIRRNQEHLFMHAELNDKWKDKYLRSLDDLEEKEKIWSEVEDLLRRTVGRLAHTGYGLDRSLDKQLDRIRDAVKGKQDAKSLESLVREASKTAVDVQEKYQTEGADTGRFLAQFLAGLELTGTRKKQAQRLHKKLKSIRNGERIQPLLEETLELLSDVPVAAKDTPAKPNEASPPRPGGLLSRLMGAENAPPQRETTGAAQTLENLLTHIKAGENCAEQLRSLRLKAAACRDEDAALRLLKETAAVLSEILDTTESAHPQDQAVLQTLPSAGEALLDLMTQIEIPHHLQERLGSIKTSLLQASTAEQVHLTVQSIADLMGDLRREVQNEKRELEAFLEGVTNRIQVLSENVLDLGSNRQTSVESRKEFHQSFRDHMVGIRTRMADTEDVEVLKHAIQDGLDAIESQLTHYVRREEEVTRDAEHRIADLSSRLHDMKNEAFLLQEKMQEQRELAMKDPLTGVNNRLAFDEHIAREFSRWKRYGDPLSLCVLDIDYFKKINDNFGHLAGDKALKAMAGRLVKNVREVDIVSRYGGEEFVVIMPKTPAEPAYGVAEKLRNVIATAGFHYRQQPVHITVSCGVATFRADDDPHSVFKRADDALYGAKKAGRNRTHTEDEPAVKE